MKVEEGEKELFEHYKFKADSNQEIIRVDKFLMDRIPNTSRNKLQDAAKSGNIHVNGKQIKQNYKVKPGDEVAVVMPYPQREIELIPEDIPLDIVFEDDQLVIVNKPPNMVVHPAYGNYTGTLVNAMLHHFESLPQAKDYAGRPGLVHRLDKHTTGLLVMAKTEHALNHLSAQFFNRTSSRKYWALVWGDIEDDGTYDSHIGRSLKNRKVMDTFPEGDHGKHAVTHYKVLKRYGYVTLVECQLETGRTHQIRAHFKADRHPLFNDLEYGGDQVLRGTVFTKYKQFVQNCFKLLPGQALHAKTLGIEHPTTGEWLEFDSELPEDFAELLKKWDTYTENSK